MTQPVREAVDAFVEEVKGALAVARAAGWPDRNMMVYIKCFPMQTACRRGVARCDWLC